MAHDGCMRGLRCRGHGFSRWLEGAASVTLETVRMAPYLQGADASYSRHLTVMHMLARLAYRHVGRPGRGGRLDFGGDRRPTGLREAPH